MGVVGLASWAPLAPWTYGEESRLVAYRLEWRTGNRTDVLAGLPARGVDIVADGIGSEE